MTIMKNITLIIISALVIFFGSCKEPCEDVNCNAGNCLEGVCNCDEGYEGTNCESEVRAKYIGTWSGPNMCDNEFIELETITLVISESEENIQDLKMEIVIEGPAEIPLPPENATLFGNAFETGPTITNILGSDFTFSSDGIFKSNTELSLDFVVSGEFQSFPLVFNCTADLTKQ